jgi:hypothetical protein
MVNPGTSMPKPCKAKAPTAAQTNLIREAPSHIVNLNEISGFVRQSAVISLRDS